MKTDCTAFRRGTVLLLTALAFTACGDSGTTIGPRTPTPASVTISNPTINFSSVGATANLSLTVRDQDGNVISSPSVAYSSDNESVVTVNGAGLITATGNGTTTVRATAGSATGEASVVVEQVGTQLTVVSGTGQSGQAGVPLAEPLLVQVEDAQNNPVADATVTFSVTLGGGTLSETTVQTDASGRASTTWTPGGTLGGQTARAQVGATSSTFTATISAGPLDRLLPSNTNQSGIAGFTLPRPVGVLAVDAFSNPISGVLVDFELPDGGSVSQATGITDGQGLLGISWTLGPGAGAQSLIASSAGVSDGTIAATAVAPIPAAIGAPLTNQTAGPGEALIYTFQVPAATLQGEAGGDEVLRILRVSDTGGSGGRELFVRFGAPPEGSPTGVIADCSVPGGTDQDHECVIEDPAAGAWWALVIGIAGFEDVTVSAGLEVQRPDLVANPLFVDPAVPNNAETVTITGGITNDGSQPSGPFAWTIEVDGAEVGNGVVGNLAPGASLDGSVIRAPDVGPFATGTRNAELIVDPLDEVDEEGEANNSSQTGFEVSNAPPLLTDGVPVNNLSGGPDSQQFFRFELPDGAGDGMVLDISIRDGTGDVDMFISREALPGGLGASDCGPFANGNFETCGIPNAQGGTWFVLLEGFTTFSGVSLEASLKPLTPLQNGVPAPGFSGAEQELLYFEFDVPGAGTLSGVRGADGPSISYPAGRTGERAAEFGRKPSAGSSAGKALDESALEAGGQALGTLEITTTGGSGDADIVVPGALPVAIPGPVLCVSENIGNEESCQITNPADGPLLITVIGFTAFNGLTVESTFSPAGPPDLVPGALTVTPGSPTSAQTVLIEGSIANSGGQAAGSFGWRIEVDGTPVASGQVAGLGIGATVDNNTIRASAVGPFAEGVRSAELIVDTNAEIAESDEGNNTSQANFTVTAPGVNQDPIAILNASPTSVPAGDGNQTVVYLNGGNSTDPDGNPLTYSWTAPGGTFVGGVSTGAMVQVTFPGGASHTVTLTVDDGQGGSDQAQTVIGNGAALPAAGTFDIVIQFINTPTAAQLAAFNEAEAFWESAIRSELSNFVGFSLDLEECRTGSAVAPAEFTGTIDDLHILVLLEPIDGPNGIVGQAGPCHTRGGSSLPLSGVMIFDTADLASIEADGDLNGVIKHEMGHVLGIGRFLWTAFGFLQDPSVGAGAPLPDTRYTGAGGVGAHRALGGGATELAPVENSGVSGSADSHWRETVYGLELMTPSFTSGQGTFPASVTTIAALQDLGYVTNFAAAVPFSPNFGLIAESLAEGTRVDLSNDELQGPIFSVDESGRVTRRIR